MTQLIDIWLSYGVKLQDLWSSTKTVDFILQNIHESKKDKYFAFYMKRGFITLDSSLYKRGRAICHPKFVKLMVKNGIDMNIGSDVDLPLVLAIRRANLLSAVILLRHGAKIPVINLVDQLSRPAL